MDKGLVLPQCDAVPKVNDNTDTTVNGFPESLLHKGDESENMVLEDKVGIPELVDDHLKDKILSGLTAAASTSTDEEQIAMDDSLSRQEEEEEEEERKLLSWNLREQ